MRKSLKMATLASLLILASMTTACYGPFNLTRNLWHWNGTFENKWGREGMYLVLTIVPVYPICVLGDALIFNSIEFWGGKNPIDLTVQTSDAETDQVAAIIGLPCNVTVLPVH